MRSKYPVKTPEQLRIKNEELSENPETRTPVVICVDCSYSMGQERINEMRKGLQDFARSLSAKLIARSSVQICLISYGGKGVIVETDFMPPDQLEIPPFYYQGETPLGEAAETALTMLENQKDNYGIYGIDYYCPLIIFIGDGDATDSIRNATERLHRESAEGRVHVVSVMVGERSKAQGSSLMELSPDGKVYFLRDDNLMHFFDWLSKSMQKTSESISGEEMQYKITGTWAEILERHGQD